MNPAIPWTIAKDIPADALAKRFLEIVKPLIKPSTYETLEFLPDSTINATCIQMFKRITPKGFTFGFYSGIWGFRRA